ncbi:DNA mismatch repair endonuclease MutL [Paenibacillus sp. GCM10012307]|uniref:DNA mismatch repair protein MutL n=1 Tax=Paenibacillus roseus TaxID=2798579 RepID=A0A934J8P0_9BACL|nr:DNA mismatch repair endonuclease MutL [Paenibacillus roseus]MBJ6363633.1 DNA mismatch repair endonuclease MutL [Paenibacillus roseus]
MAKIHVLDEQLANQIAAGEVVERPSSVVKELVENAIDAGSSAIDVAIEEGGLTFIQVRDNGSGIEEEDLETAFLRHATSKLLSSKDLFRIASLGFRGEALPSIAAVARVECVTAVDDSGLGTRLVMEGGKVISREAAAARQGMEMTVRDLFYNTPARLKYMKSIQTELGHISDYIYRLSMAHPGIAFTLKHNGTSLLRTLGNGERQQVIAAVYGTTLAKAMLPVEGEHPDYDLRGYISKPEQTRANRNGMTTIVNGRYIRSFALNQAILQAYHTLLPINRYPMAVIEIGMHPSLVDVNVHPSKMEVRFSKETELKEFVQQSIRKALGEQAHIPEAAVSSERSKPVFVQEQISFHRPEPKDQWGDLQRSSAGGPSQRGDFSHGTAEQAPVIPPDAARKLYKPSERLSAGDFLRETGEHDVSPRAIPGQQASFGQPSWAPEAGRSSATAVPGTQEEASNGQQNGWKRDEESGRTAGNANAGAFPELSWVGQLHGTYLIGQNESGMYLIDQHAAHERIHYEYYYEKFGRPQEASQQLLVPHTLEFTSVEAELLRERIDLFEQAGVEVEAFGQNAFLVRSHPQWMPKGEELDVIEEIADWILTEKKAVDIGKLREKAAILCSCKASIKANQRLSREEGETLIQRLAACKQPYTCPHGRPIVVHLSTYQLEKMFKRVM